MAAWSVGTSSGSHQVLSTRNFARGTERRRRRANQANARRLSNAAARKQAPTRATMDIQRQGNCTKRSLGRMLQRGDVTRSMSSVAAAARRRSASQVWRRGLWESAKEAKRRERKAAVAQTRMSRVAQEE